MTTYAILASGPSMSPAVVDAVRASGARAIVINDTYRLMPDAWALFAADARWWLANPDALLFAGRRFVSECDRVPNAHFIPPRLMPYGSLKGSTSAIQAAYLAEDLGATRILLCGVDLRDDEPSHWHGLHRDGLDNPTPQHFRLARAAWTAYSLRTTCDVVNCNPRSALDCFPRVSSVEDACALSM